MSWQKNEPYSKPAKDEKVIFIDKTALGGGPWATNYTGEYDADSQTWIDDKGNTVDDADVGFWMRLPGHPTPPSPLAPV